MQVKVTVTGELFQPAAFGAGETVAVIDGGPAEVTVRLDKNPNPPTVAEMVAVPAPDAVTIPVELTVATFGAEEAQDAANVTSCEVPFE